MSIKAPDTIRLALSCADGTMAIMTFVVDDHRGTQQPVSPAAIALQIAKTFEMQPEKLPASYRIIEESEIPADRTYRNAWVDRGGRVQHDMPKARDLHRERLRTMRKPLLEQLDVEQLRAGSDAQRLGEIAMAKQRLRDLTKHPDIDAAETIDALHVHALTSFGG